jgi:hypothetical protein
MYVIHIPHAIEILPDLTSPTAYACKLGILAGTLYITKNYLCFSAKAFGLNKKVRTGEDSECEGY